MASQRAEHALTYAIADRIGAWFGPSNTPQGYERVRESVVLLESALADLGDRDRDGIAAELTAERDALVAALDALASVAGDLDRLRGCNSTGDFETRGFAGEAFADQADENDRADSELNRARESGSIEAIERAWFGWNRAVEAQAVLIAACRYPAKQPDPKLYAQAADDTSSLYNTEKSLPATAVEIACMQGRSSRVEVARRWACFEPVETDATRFRWQRYLERT